MLIGGFLLLLFVVLTLLVAFAIVLYFTLFWFLIAVVDCWLLV